MGLARKPLGNGTGVPGGQESQSTSKDWRTPSFDDAVQKNWGGVGIDASLNQIRSAFRSLEGQEIPESMSFTEGMNLLIEHHGVDAVAKVCSEQAREKDGSAAEGMAQPDQELLAGGVSALAQAVMDDMDGGREDENALGLDLGKVEALMNSMGNLLVKNYDGRDVYLQSDDDVESFKLNLEKEQVKDLEDGYPVVLDDPGYFEENYESGQKEIRLGARLRGSPLVFVDNELSYQGRHVLAVKDPERGPLEVARLIEWLQEDVEVHTFNSEGKREVLDLEEAWAKTYAVPDPQRVGNILNGLGYGIMKASGAPGILLDQNTGMAWDLQDFNKDGCLRRLDGGEEARADLRAEGALAHKDGSLGAALAVIRHLVERGAKPLAPLEVKYVFPDEGRRGDITLLVRCLLADTEAGKTHFMTQVVRRLSDGAEPVLGAFAGSYAGARPEGEKLGRMKLLVESAKLLSGMDDTAWMNHVLQAGPGERFSFDGLNPAAREAWRKSGSLIRKAGATLLREING